MQLLIAQPDHAERISTFYRGIHGPEFPHQELLDGPTLSRLLRDGEVALVVATDERSILGCGLSFPRAWNQSLEIGALSVDDVPERTQIAKALFEGLRRFGIKKFGVAFFRAGNEVAFKRAREIGATCWGFRPTPGSRDINTAELLMGFGEIGGDALRIKPPPNSVTQAPFAQRIIESLGETDEDMPYPTSFPVGAPRGTGSVVISGRVWPTYHSRGNYITIENSAGRFPVEIIREFVDKVREKGVTDIRMTVPVNHEEEILELLDFGFAPVSYLPGWFLRGAHRFDCIELVAGLPRIPRVTEDFMARATAKIVNELTPKA